MSKFSVLIEKGKDDKTVIIGKTANPTRRCLSFQRAEKRRLISDPWHDAKGLLRR